MKKITFYSTNLEKETWEYLDLVSLSKTEKVGRDGNLRTEHKLHVNGVVYSWHWIGRETYERIKKILLGKLRRSDGN
jgi:hypothetical protein